jgi:hypothetical protein
MKTSLITAAIAIVAIYIATTLSSCSQLAGTSIMFDENGNAIIMPPSKAFVIEAESGK